MILNIVVPGFHKMHAGQHFVAPANLKVTDRAVRVLARQRCTATHDGDVALMVGAVPRLHPPQILGVPGLRDRGQLVAHTSHIAAPWALALQLL